MTDALDSVRSRLSGSNEKILLAVYFVVILVLAVELASILQTAWIRSNIVKALFGLRHYVGLTLAAVSVFFLGLFLGLLFLMIADPMKRVQGTLLFIGTVLAGIIMFQANFLFDNIGVDTISYLVGGLALGLLLGGGAKFARRDQIKRLEFRRASKGLYAIVTILLVFAFLEYHIAYPDLFRVTADGVVPLIPLGNNSLFISIKTDGLIQNGVVIGSFVFTLQRFIQYDSKRTYFVLGPRTGGKSMFMLGTFIEAQRQADSSNRSSDPLNPSQDMAEMVGELDQVNEGWPADATETNAVKDLSLTHTTGNVFPVQLDINLIDYAGEQLQQIPGALEDLRMGNDEGMDPTLRRLAEGVIQADTLILTLDVERFVNDNSMDIEAYFGILEQTDVVKMRLVATKADYLADSFREQEKLNYYQEWDLFTAFVNDELRKSEQVKTLVAQSTSETIYPVGVQTKEDENGELVPISNQGSLQVEGYRKFLEALE